MSWRSDSYNIKLWEKLLETWLLCSYTLLKWVHGAFFSNVNHDSAQGTVESTFTAIIWVEPSFWRLIGLSGMYPYQPGGDPMKNTWEHTSAEPN